MSLVKLIIFVAWFHQICAKNIWICRHSKHQSYSKYRTEHFDY